MPYNLIGANTIPAVTGGVFDYERVLTVSDSLQTTPAFILASYIIEQAIASMTDPADDDDWPLYVSRMPDSDVKTNLGVLYDTTGIKDGRYMEGGVVVHEGVQLKIRSDSHVTGWTKTEAIAVILDSVLNASIIIDTVEYQIQNIKRTSPVISLGAEEGTKERRLFTVNFLITLRRVT